MPTYYTESDLRGFAAELAELVDEFEARANTPLERLRASDLRLGLEALADNVTEPVLNDNNEALTQDEYDAMDSRLNAMRDNVTAVFYDLARRSNKAHINPTQMVKEMDWLEAPRTVIEVDDFVAEWLDGADEDAASAVSAAETEPEDGYGDGFSVPIYYVCHVTKNGKHVVLTGPGGKKSRMLAKQGLAAIRRKLYARHKDTLRSPGLLRLTDKFGRPFTLVPETGE